MKTFTRIRALIGALVVLGAIVMAQPRQAEAASRHAQGTSRHTLPAAHHAWHRVATLSASGGKSGATFRLRGTGQRLVYSKTGRPWRVASVAVTETTSWLPEQDCYASTIVAGGDGGVIDLRLKTGRYYLSGFGDGGAWRVTMFERW